MTQLIHICDQNRHKVLLLFLDDLFQCVGGLLFLLCIPCPWLSDTSGWYWRLTRVTVNSTLSISMRVLSMRKWIRVLSTLVYASVRKMSIDDLWSANQITFFGDDLKQRREKSKARRLIEKIMGWFSYLIIFDAHIESSNGSCQILQWTANEWIVRYGRIRVSAHQRWNQV